MPLSKQRVSSRVLILGEKCFKFVFLDPTDGVDWDEAMRRCRVPGRKSDIASTHGPYEHGKSLHWHHNERDGVSYHRCLDGLLNPFCSGVDQRKHQNSALLAFVRRIHRWSVNSPHKGPVTRKMFPFDDIIMYIEIWYDLTVNTVLLALLCDNQSPYWQASPNK